MKSSTIKGITIAIGGDTSEFSSSLREVNKTTRTLQKELKGTSSLLKMDPTNTDLIKQKMLLLGESVSETQKKIELLKDAQEKMKANGVDETSEGYRDLQREIAYTEQNLKKLVAEQISFTAKTSTLGQVGQKFEDVGNKISTAGEKLTAVSAAAAAAVASVSALAVSGGAAADDINTLAKVTGLSTDSLQKYSYIADLVDVSVEDLAKAMAKTTKSMQAYQSGTTATVEAFDTLGVAVTDSNGNLRDNEDVFTDLINALGNMENETQRDALAMTLLGKSATGLNPLIETGTSSIKSMGQELEDMGLIMSQDALDSANSLNDGIDRLKSAMSQTALAISSKIAPVVTSYLSDAESGIAYLVKKIQSLDTEQVKSIAKLTLLTAALAPALTIMGKLTVTIGQAVQTVSAMRAAMIAAKTATTGATTAQLVFNAAMEANPAALVATALTALGTVIVGITAVCVSAKKASADLTVAAKSELSAVKESTQAYLESKEAREQATAQEVAEIENCQSLAAELITLAGADGKVTSANKERAKFILGQLNEALGTEYTMTSNQINNYQQLRKEINKTVEAKKAEILLESAEESYAEAVKNKNAADEKSAELTLKIKELTQQKAQAQERVNAAEEEYKKYLGTPAATEKLRTLNEEKAGLDDVTTALKKTKSAYEKNETKATGYYSAISKYESAAVEAQKGNYSKVIKILSGEAEAYTSSKSKVTSSTSEKVKTLKESYEKAAAHWENMKERYAKGDEGITKQMVKDAGSTAKKLKKEWQSVANSSATGYISTLGGTEALKRAYNKGYALAGASISGANARLKINSPSKVWRDIAEYSVQGFEQGASGQGVARMKRAGALLAGASVSGISVGGYSSASGYQQNTNFVSGTSNILTQILTSIKEGQFITLSDGALVGGTAKKMKTAISAVSSLERWV